ncbi:unnamed protein product [Ilex paraguariensis]|uniref:ABC transporter domain-containing protein n=1 Tax=Ilex paraguariensis TaxID=185542 RepID=A0ABC8T842_9AQUA
MGTPVNVPRWTPRPRPTSTHDPEMDSFVSEENDISFGNMNNTVPFSTAVSPTLPHTDLRVHPELKTSLEMEQAQVFGESKQKENTISCDSEGNIGIFLTWKELWVTVPEKKGECRPILQGLTGYVKPGEVLAVMGPSGCGKSTLLDALAGRLDSNTRQNGEILINGHKQTLAFGTSVS